MSEPDISSGIILDFPMRGEWIAPATPAKKVPSHGLDAFGEIVLAEDGVPERDPVRLRSDMKYMVEVTRRFKAGKASYREVAGNYIVMKCSGGY